MTDFQVEYVGDKPGDIQNRLSELGTVAQTRTDEELLSTAKEVKDDLEETSPHDTGEYERSWYIRQVGEGEVWVLNEADHAPFVMLPNSKMVGSEEADLPTTGVLHNVKGVARENSSGLSSNIQQAIQDLIEEFGV